MNNNFKPVIDGVVSLNMPDTNVTNEQLSTYLTLLYYSIEHFFKGKRYEIFFNGKISNRTYNIDICSFLSLMEIQDEMLDAGADLCFSLYRLNNYENKEFDKAYDDFVEESDVYKLNYEKNKSVKTLKDINDTAKRLLLYYFNNR